MHKSTLPGALLTILLAITFLAAGCDLQTATLSPDAPGAEWAEAPAALVKSTFGEVALPGNLTRADIVDREVTTTEDGFRLLVVTFKKPEGGTCQSGMVVYDPNAPLKPPGGRFSCYGETCSTCVAEWVIGSNSIKCYCDDPGNGCILEVHD